MSESPAARAAHAQDGVAAPAAPQCPNCGSNTVASFCADCGQDQTDPRRRWNEHVNELASTYLGLDMRAARTFGLGVRRPGMLSLLQLQNRAGAYVTPLKMFLIAVLLYSVFFAVSPIKFDQFYVAQDHVLYGPPVSGEVDPAAWSHDVLRYAPKLADPVDPGFRAALADGTIDLQTLEPRWVADIVANPAKADTLNDRLTTVLLYMPLFFIPALVLVNGFLFRKRYLLFDHFYVAFEAAAAIIMIVMLTAAGVSLFHAAGVRLNDAVPILFEFPVLIFYLTTMARRYYGLSWGRAFGDAMAVLVVFLVIEEPIFYAAIELVGRTV